MNKARMNPRVGRTSGSRRRGIHKVLTRREGATKGLPQFILRKTILGDRIIKRDLRSAHPGTNQGRSETDEGPSDARERR